MRTTTFTNFLGMVIILSFIGCDSETNRWKKASNSNTVMAYEDFSARYPEGVFADSASQKLEKLYFEKTISEDAIPVYEDYLNHYPAGRFVDSVRLRLRILYSMAAHEGKRLKIVVSESYGRAKGVNLPFEEIVRGFFQNTTVSIVNDTPCAILSVNVIGEPLGANYGSFPACYLYTGAKGSGTITIEIPNGKEAKRSFRGYVEPKPIVGFNWEDGVGYYVRAENAPFNQAFIKDTKFVVLLASIINEVYGSDEALDAMVSAALCSNLDAQNYALEVLSKSNDNRIVESLAEALKNDNSEIRFRAAHALCWIPDVRAVESLIAAFSDENQAVASQAETALEKIKDVRTIDLLIVSLNNESWLFRMHVLATLRKMTGVDFGDRAGKWRKWWEKNKVNY